ncbi:MAG: hypothetical protein IJ773_12355 [Lachnospiraceae bacterium]|nr:hypothetical protein [Lachnospiraceae bacterium]
MRNEVGIWIAIFVVIWISLLYGGQLELSLPHDGNEAETDDPAQVNSGVVDTSQDDLDAADPAQAFLGEWICGDTLITISRQEEGHYLCVVDRMENEQTTTLWEYECDFDGYTLTGASTGIKTRITRDENGEETQREVLYDDGYGIFQIEESGEMIWSDFKEMAGFEQRFVKG